MDARFVIADTLMLITRLKRENSFQGGSKLSDISLRLSRIMTIRLLRCVKRGILLLSQRSMVLLCIIYQKGNQLSGKCLLSGVFRALTGLLITLKRRKCTIICIQMYRPILVLYLSLSCGPKKLYMYSFWGNPDFITENWESTRQSATDYKSCQAEGRDHWTKAKEDKACAWATYALGRAWEEGIENWSKVEIRNCSSKTLSQ